MRGHFEPQVWDVRIDVGSILEINIGSSVAIGSIKQLIFWKVSIENWNMSKTRAKSIKKQSQESAYRIAYKNPPKCFLLTNSDVSWPDLIPWLINVGE